MIAKLDKQLEVRYFAALRERRGLSVESIQTAAETPLDLYRELSAKHDLRMDEGLVRVAVGDEFVEMGSPLSNGDVVTFIPPVAGG
jgi:molybdopterin synthase sulfur carrier subunit